MRQGWKVSGFTLVELVVVMAVFGVIAALAAPSFRDFVLQRTISAQVAELGSALRLARSEAIKRGAPVTVCPTTTAHEAVPVCATGAEWAAGYLVLIDNGTADAQYLRVQQGGSGQGRITANVAGPLLFQGNGILRAGGASEFIFAPNLPEDSASFAALKRTLCIGRTGVLTNGGCR